MRFEDALPILEGKLYAWAEWRQRDDRPSAAISSVYEGQIGRTETTSPQERYVIRQAMVYEAGIIEDALRRCSQEQKQLVFRRYVKRETWEEITEALHMSRRTAYRVRDQALAVVASALGIWEDGGVA